MSPAGSEARARLAIVAGALAGALGASGCLEPSDEAVPLQAILRDPSQAPRVETLPDYPSRRPFFTRRIEYLRGFAEGEPVWYWAVDGANSRLIAPAFEIVDAAGDRLQWPVIDSLPGDAGYTPWWRVVRFQVTDRWAGETFTSRAAVDAGLREGKLLGPVVTRDVLDAPVTVPGLTAFDGERTAVRTSSVWYRDAIADWVEFDVRVRLDPQVRELPALPVYIFQRIDEPLPIYEFATGVDVTGDEALNDSNNVFALGVGSPGYSPLWYTALVRTTRDYISIDTNPPSRDVGLSAEDQFFDPTREAVLSSNVVDVAPRPDDLVNCPIQDGHGTLERRTAP